MQFRGSAFAGADPQFRGGAQRAASLEMLPKGLDKRSLLIGIGADGSGPDGRDVRGPDAASLGSGDRRLPEV